MAVLSELGLLLNLVCGGGKSLEHLTNIRAVLHGDDAKLILFVNPDQKGLVVIVENTTSLGPFAFEQSGLQVLVASLEQEMILNQLFALVVGHLAQ